MVRIVTKAWGPILIQGEVELVDQDGNVIIPPPAKTPGTIKLCSCGHSSIPPSATATTSRFLPRSPPPATAPPPDFRNYFKSTGSLSFSLR